MLMLPLLSAPSPLSPPPTPPPTSPPLVSGLAGSKDDVSSNLKFEKESKMEEDPAIVSSFLSLAEACVTSVIMEGGDNTIVVLGGKLY